MSTLHIGLLGPPQVLVGGAPLKVDTRKAIALLAYLAVEPGSHRRETLAAMFWPEANEARARSALRRTLSSLRTGVGEEWLDTDRDQVALSVGDVEVDTERFVQLLEESESHGHAADAVCPACVRPLGEAASLYRADFLAGFTLRDSPSFDDWQLRQAEAFRLLQSSILGRLAMAQAAHGELDKALETARSWVTLEPYDEAAHRQLMVLYDWTGNRAQALRQYEECRRLLDDELGVPPLDETTRLYEAIVAERLPPPPAGRRAGVSPIGFPEVHAPDQPYPLVGRDREWTLLTGGADAASGRGHLFVVEGEAGIGKTRLAEELVDVAEARGAYRLAVRAHESDGYLPYGLITEALRNAAADEAVLERLLATSPSRLSEVARLLPELRDMFPELPSPPALEDPGEKSHFFESVRHVLLDAGGGAPVVVLIDDAHWVDDGSLDLLSYLVKRIEDDALWLILTWRTERVPATHRLRRLTREAERRNRATAVVPSRLGRDAIAQLVGESARGDPDFVDRLYRISEGVPFLLVAYLEAVAESSPGTSPPDSVSKLLQSRLEGISETGMHALTTGAVIGRSFHPDLVATVSGLDDGDVVAALEELLDLGLIIELEEAAVLDFSHQLLQQQAYRRLSSARRRLLHRNLADALATQSLAGWDLGAVAAEIAFHYQQGGRPEQAAEYFSLAGEHARSLAAFADAIDHFAAAIELGHPDPRRLQEVIGDLHVLGGEYGLALDSYHRARDLDPDAWQLHHKVGDIYRRLGAWELAERHFVQSLDLLDDELPAERSLVAADRCFVADKVGDAVAARQLAAEALELAHTSGDALAIAQAHNVLGILASHRGRTDEARTHLEESLLLAEELEDEETLIAVLNNLALIWGSSGEADQGIQHLERALQLSASAGDRHKEAALRSNLADLHRAQGRIDTAMEQLKAAAALFADVGVAPGEWEPEIWKLREW